MTHREILTKAVEKAMQNGFDLVKVGKEMGFEHFLTSNDEYNYFKPAVAMKGYSYAIIFNHDFAKAIWPDVPVKLGRVEDADFSSWQWHLQQMVISDDPIVYLGAHL